MKKENKIKEFKNEIKNQEKCENMSDFIDRNFTEVLAMPLSKLFVKLGFHPNLVTFLSLIFGIAGSVFFVFDEMYFTLIGIGLIIFSAILDASDGQVARLSHKSSVNGRFLDGVCDGLVYISIYISIVIRMYLGGVHIIIAILYIIFGLIYHLNQSNIADYSRQIHMFITSKNTKHELHESEEFKNQLKSFDKKLFNINYYRVKTFYKLTKGEEKLFPTFVCLYEEIKKDNYNISDEMIADFKKVSTKFFIRLSYALTFNIRTYVLFILLLLDAPFFIVPFTILILEPIALIIKNKVENVSADLLIKYYLKDQINEITNKK